VGVAPRHQIRMALAALQGTFPVDLRFRATLRNRSYSPIASALVLNCLNCWNIVRRHRSSHSFGRSSGKPWCTREILVCTPRAWYLLVTSCLRSCTIYACNWCSRVDRSSVATWLHGVLNFVVRGVMFLEKVPNGGLDGDNSNPKDRTHLLAKDN
jgi:hypothetical protein